MKQRNHLRGKKWNKDQNSSPKSWLCYHMLWKIQKKYHKNKGYSPINIYLTPCSKMHILVHLSQINLLLDYEFSNKCLSWFTPLFFLLAKWQHFDINLGGGFRSIFKNVNLWHKQPNTDTPHARMKYHQIIWLKKSESRTGSLEAVNTVISFKSLKKIFATGVFLSNNIISIEISIIGSEMTARPSVLKLLLATFLQS